MVTDRFIQSPRILYKAIARTLTANKQSNTSGNNPDSTQNPEINLNTDQHLFETNRIEDIQATSILKSLMESYSSHNLNPQGQDDLDAGSFTNYVEFDQEDDETTDENNQTFLINVHEESDDSNCLFKKRRIIDE